MSLELAVVAEADLAVGAAVLLGAALALGVCWVQRGGQASPVGWVFRKRPSTGWGRLRGLAGRGRRRVWGTGGAGVFGVPWSKQFHSGSCHNKMVTINVLDRKIRLVNEKNSRLVSMSMKFKKSLWLEALEIGTCVGWGLHPTTEHSPSQKLPRGAIGRGGRGGGPFWMIHPSEAAPLCKANILEAA